MNGHRAHPSATRRPAPIPAAASLALGMAFAVLGGAPAAHADDILRISGAPYEGVSIVSATWETVSYRREGISTRQDVPAEDVDSIRWTSEPATLSRGRGNLADGDYERALGAFKAASSLPEEVHALNAQYLVGVTELEWSQKDATHLDAAVKALGDYVSAGKPKKHFYVPHAILALAEAHIRAGDFAKASQSLSDLTGGAMGRKWVEAAKVKNGQALLAQEKFPEARELFRDVRSSSNPSFAMEATIGYAACEVGQKQYPAAVNTLREVLGEGSNERNSNPPRYGDLRGRAWIVYGQAEEGAAGTDPEKLRWAALRYLRATTVAVAGGETFAEALFRAQVVFQKLGQEDRVQALRQRMNQLCPNSPWNRDPR